MIIKKISYCSVCKGRLWQLKKTLFQNLESLRKNPNIEWIILDFNCTDNVSEELVKIPQVKHYIQTNQLKIYKLEKNFQYDIPLGKNVAHYLSTGEVVFNLDIDNYIDNSIMYLNNLKEDEILTVDSTYLDGDRGRIGLYKDLFLSLGGYNLALEGAAAHDIHLIECAKALGIKEKLEKTTFKFVPNTKEDTAKYLEKPYSYYLKKTYKDHLTLLKNKEYYSNQGTCITAQQNVDLLDHVINAFTNERYDKFENKEMLLIRDVYAG